MKGIVLAGGSGSRLKPMTKAYSKHLLPIYDKPMIHYPLATLMLAGISEILIIATPRDLPLYEHLLSGIHKLGVSISFAVQDRPAGIAQAFIIAENFLDGDACTLILGDNLFFGHDLATTLKDCLAKNTGATVFGYRVSDPRQYGVVSFDEQGKATQFDEKPANPASQYAVTGLYIYDESVLELSKTLMPSQRNELEITDINNLYLKNDKLDVEILGRGFTWIDAGTPASLLDASNFVSMIQNRQGFKIACIEEIAWRNGWISTETVLRLVHNSETDNQDYLQTLVTDTIS